MEGVVHNGKYDVLAPVGYRHYSNAATLETAQDYAKMFEGGYYIEFTPDCKPECPTWHMHQYHTKYAVIIPL